ncbi:MAG: YccF domain-containing protein [Jaaginema sp. PMC 1079.18]|nr:YccF domain-containing protein [Jaaginema sp. PMC 1080.18]MEC4853146.1 YccF domain-containing protein [Jaaginema sp. PMC 1079.18]MEC4868819.1 YccF domain-containing protein [Jaaginema sp. PMC 1078.18]
MSLLGNIIWLIFGGFLSGIGYIVGGLSLCLTIIGIPFGIQSIKIGFATMTPFGREVVESRTANGTLETIFNVIWIVLFGWGIALSHITHAAILAITIVGLPFAKQHIKLINMALFPFGRDFQAIDKVSSKLDSTNLA